ncbi:nucleotidyltransferase family protein [Roseibacillus ishigakijimensis]|uniref:NTP transferase domain-containing protein n=1 Tax=Roseibacillus ishigakijimensis TaxID=454146 RepID=A0A934VMB5_9BACT|nr:sugar phosphate nucleotidyltransferase [Roseibacillus ishigakijimensis]MBK1834107.1 NTP transferase domain-containing protein [Roseibacillus ishigakijimensis]
MSKPTLLVLAAGMGSRYGGLKQMDPMGPNGETILDYSVFDAIRAGFGKVVFVIREDFAEAFKEGVGARFADRIEIDYAFQQLDDLPEGFSVPEGREKPWGTAHAVRAARHVINEPFAVINADDFYGANAYQTAADFLTNLPTDSTDYAIVGYYLKNTLSDHGGVNRGICTASADGLLVNVEEVVDIKRQADGTVAGTGLDEKTRLVSEEDIVSMNFWCFSPAYFAQTEEHFAAFLREKIETPKSECYIPTVVDDFVEKGRATCKILPTSSSWFGVTYPDDKPLVVDAVAGLIAAGEYPEKLS